MRSTTLRVGLWSLTMAVLAAGWLVPVKAGPNRTAVRLLRAAVIGAPHNIVSAKDTTLQNAAVATGNGTIMSVGGLPFIAVQVTGTFVGTVTFEGTVNGTWVSQ